MKKLFLAGVLTAAMAISTSAFAAVSYGENDTLGVTYDPATNKVSVTTDLSTYNGQMTLLVLDKGASAVTSDTILYIDQDAAPEAGAKIFQDMGLKMPADVTTLPAGTYPVKVGSDDASLTALLVGNIIVTEDAGGKKITLVYGDVTGDDEANTDDGMAILSKMVGGPLKVTGGAYDIGTAVTADFVYGDVTGDGEANTDDGMAILSKMVGGPLKVTGGVYDIGTPVELTVQE